MAQTRTRYFFPLSKPLNAKLADTAFTAGLLHDIGKLLLAGNIPDTYDKIIEQAQRRKAPLPQVELEVLGCTHAEVGACLLGLWGLPLPILEAIAWHHTPAQSEDQDFTLLTAVHVADALDHEKKAAPGECPAGFINNCYLEKIGLGDRGNDWRKLGGCTPKAKQANPFQEAQRRELAKAG